MHTAEVRTVDSGLQICELLVERCDGLFEHSPVRRGTRAAEVVACPRPRQLQRTSALFDGQLFRRHPGAARDLPSGRFFLLGFNGLGFKTAGHPGHCTVAVDT
jgi:hypothetical protein